VPRPERRRPVATLILAFASTIVSLLSLELGARALGLRTGYFLAPTRTDCLARSPLLEWEFRPSCTGRLVDAALHINGAGLRSPEIRDDGSIRVLALGDSSTFGWNVDPEQAYPGALERLLNRRAGERRYQVINAGVAGYSSYQGLVYLRERGLALKPAIVLIGFGFNELFRIGDDEARLARERRWLPLLRVNDVLLERSTLYRWLRWKASKVAPPKLGYRVAPERYGENLREMIRLVRAHGGQAALLDFFAHPVADTPEQRFPETLAAVAAELDVPLVVYDGPRLDLVHPTREGYEMLAAKIVAALEEKGYLAGIHDDGARTR
jgi:lysophospholipase L1-like esterase